MEVFTNIKILYEDNHLLVVEKPANILSQGDRSGDIDLLTILKNDIKERYNKPGNVYLGLVHRLDRPVGGVMVFARTSKAASRLSEQIRNRDFKKIYLAVIRGIPIKKIGRLQHYLRKDSQNNIVQGFKYPEKNALEAVLDYEVLESKDQLSLVKIQLHTGRPHQIRVQFSLEGFPLYGDQKYGKNVNRSGQQIALWSTVISLNHPTKKERMVFTCLPPNCDPWTYFKIKEKIVNKVERSYSS